MLARREHSRAELSTKLVSRGHDREILGAVLEQLETDDYLSDERFASSYVRSRVGKGYGPVAIRSGLRERGVRGAIADLAMEEVDDDWQTLCEQSRQRKFGEQGPDNRKDWGVQARFLARRGFSEGQIRTVLRAVSKM